MTQNGYSTTIPTSKRWSNRSPTVEPRWVRPKTEHRAQTNLTESISGRSLYLVRGPTRRLTIKDGSKLVVNRDWVNHQASSLSHYIHVLSGSFITYDYFSKLIRKSYSQTFFLNLYTKSPWNSGSNTPCLRRNLSPILNLDIRSYWRCSQSFCIHTENRITEKKNEKK